MKFVYFGQILFNIAKTFAAHHEKSFVPAFSKVSIAHSFDNRWVWKKKLLFWKNVWKNSWIQFGFKNRQEPCTSLYTLKLSWVHLLILNKSIYLSFFSAKTFLETGDI